MNANNETSDSGPTIAGEDQRYFRAIEDAFIRLRGAPLLLSPADWRQAREWREEGIPLEIVVSALEGVFRKREERGAKGSVSSLRYCRRAIEAAWADAKELLLISPRASHSDEGAPGEAEASLRVEPRLRALAAALPKPLLWQGIRTKIQRLASIDELPLDQAAVEHALTELDSEALQVAEAALGEEAQEKLRSALESALTSLRHRLPEAQVEKARERLRRGYLREAVGLPLLSLFAPEVEKALEDEKVLEGEKALDDREQPVDD